MDGGSPEPRLGATWDGAGVDFALFSAHARAIELCLFAADVPADESRRVPLTRGSNDVWHARVDGLDPGQLYGYRVDGPYAPRDGHRFNHTKLLLDPYARAITPLAAWSDRVLGYTPGRPEEDLARDVRDDAAVMPRALVVDPRFEWGDDRPPGTPWERTLIYEMHVKGMTVRHPGVPEALRGTFAGVASPALLEHLVALGVTAVELLPVQHSFPERHLAVRGVTNYWGYNTIGFFAPDARYASDRAPGAQVREFQAMVRALHRAGIEVILDVVYNHTAEGDRLGPTLAFRGIDNRTYYRLADGNERDYVNYTGCGNTLDIRQPRVRALVLDSLRYWVTTMHVDGFRFDLASVLGRDPDAFDAGAAFFAAVRTDPVLAAVKLIAEPWDATPDGYRVGGFPPPWREWNDRYRDSVRRWWRGDAWQAGELARRIAGSPDLYAPDNRGPTASVNFVTAHDGFSLRDLVSYERKHNESNGENNRDGTDDNVSCNYGVEGATNDPVVLATRVRQQRNFLATLLLSQGVPMLRAGDEIGQTQLGNNNAYCHDDALTWVDWALDDERAALLAFTRRVAAVVRRHPELRRTRSFAGTETPPPVLAWYAPSGAPMRDDEWHDAERRSLGLRRGLGRAGDWNGGGDGDEPSLLILLNAAPEAVEFTLPADGAPAGWTTLLDTVRPDAPATHVGERYPLAPRSLAVLESRPAKAR